MGAELDSQELERFTELMFRDEVVPALERYIEIPNKSPAFDTRWRSHGHMHRAVELIEQWCAGRPIPGLTVEVIELPRRTPVIWMEVPGQGEQTILLYGHLDKQPEMEGWRDGLGPWTPVREGDRLYGRGGADDGYAAFACLTALEALARQSRGHSRCVVLIEACEESGSPDLPHYVEHLADRIGEPALVICLDSGCGNYEQLWSTTSLRGLVGGELSVEILTEGVHSGDASGVVPSSFRILRGLLSRLEDERNGAIHPGWLHAEIPSERRSQAAHMAKVLGPGVFEKYPFAEGAGPVGDAAIELVLNRTWRPALSITGIDGIPSVGDAGNVLRPRTSAKLSLRLPPTLDASQVSTRLKELFEADPPYGARVRFKSEAPASGWNAPPLASWLERSLDRASRAHFNQPSVFMGEGGSIPFIGMLAARYPEAQFLVTGVLGPASNAHGPNEFLHLPTAQRLTCCVAEVIADQLESGGEGRS